MDLGLAGKVAVVAGGARGCGRGISEALAAEGASVVLVGRQAEVVRTATNHIREAGGEAHGVTADMTTEDGVRTIAGEARQRYGEPDILVINAPSPQRRSPEHTRGFENCDDADYMKMY